jgi:hypothetical protein
MDLHNLTNFQKLMLINAHPAKMVLNIIGGVIALYFLWQHQLISAVLLGGIFIIAGTIIAIKFYTISPEKVADTFLGKMFLRYSTNLGFTFYLTSHILIPVSFWFHNLKLAAFGLILLVCGLLRTK